MARNAVFGWKMRLVDLFAVIARLWRTLGKRPRIRLFRLKAGAYNRILTVGSQYGLLLAVIMVTRLYVSCRHPINDFSADNKALIGVEICFIN